MPRTRSEDERLLSKDEHELVSRTRQLILKALPDPELADLVTRLRERRDRARDMASRQRREMRGKAAPAGVNPASDDTGTRAKRDLLAAALKRAIREGERRQTSMARGDLVSSAQRALAMKQAADEQAPDRPSSQTANEGMRSLPHTDQAPSGALDAEGYRPVLERSRKVR